MNTAVVIAGIVSAGALVASLLYLARQTREATNQTRLSNQTAAVEAYNESFRQVGATLAWFMTYPELRRFFYDGVSLDDENVDAALRERALTLAELLADGLETGFEAIKTFAFAAVNQDDLADYVAFLLKQSPVLRNVVLDHPTWWPHLTRSLETAALQRPPQTPGRDARPRSE